MSPPKGQPVVDLSVGMVYPLPSRLQATLNPVQRWLRSSFGVILYLLIGLFLPAIPVIGIPPVLFFLEYIGLLPHWPVQRFYDLCTANWMSVMTLFYESFFGIKIRSFGHSGKFKRRCMIILNHVSHLDWMYFWDVVDRQGDLSFWKPITKIKPVRDIPILGHCMQMSCHLFISRKWKVDCVEFQKKLYYFNALDYPIQLFMFPEGRDLTVNSKKISDDYAEKNGLPHYQYCLHPHTTGFTYAMNALRDGGLDAIYDVTIAYPDAMPKTELDVMKGILPREVHFHVKCYDNKDIPEDQEELGEWLKDCWKEKETRLKNYYTYGEFREDINGSYEKQNGKHHVGNGKDRASPEVFNPVNFPFLLYSFFIFVFTNAILIFPLMFIPFFWVYMIVGCLFLAWGGHVGFGNMRIWFKRKEIKKLLEQSKYNTNTVS